MRFVVLFTTAGLAACASGGTTQMGSPAEHTVRVVSPTGTSSLTMPGGERSNVRALPYTVEQVWRALPAVFDSLGIPIGAMDAATRTAGNLAYKVHGRLKNVPLSRYVDCGSSTNMGPNADSYDVVLSLMIAVRPGETAGSASVATSFDAVGRPATFAQEYSECPSKGALETRLLELLAARLKG